MNEVTPWKATSENGFNYLKLIEQFGCSPIDGELIKRFERVTKTKAHTFMRRGIFFSHKDLEKCLDDCENGKQIFLYTGRGPSYGMHLGHTIPFTLTAYLQKAFNAMCIIQMSDDEKYHFKDNELDYFHNLTRENAKDIIACGFDPQKTFIFSNLDTVGGDYYKVIVQIMKKTTGNQIRGIYGLNLDNNVGEISWPCFQAAPAFNQSFPRILGQEPIRCLVTMAIDQTPFFRMARDFGERMGSRGFIKPAEIHTKFLVGLGGINDKMSSSGQNTQNYTIFLTDSKEVVFNKINKNAFSGGKQTKKEHQELGADLSVDVPYQYLLHFLDDDSKLEEIAIKYRNGEMMTSEIKKITAEVCWDYIEKHQKRVSGLSDEYIDSFFDANHKYPPLKLDISDKEGIINEDQDYSSLGFNYDCYFGSAQKKN